MFSMSPGLTTHVWDPATADPRALLVRPDEVKTTWTVYDGIHAYADFDAAGVLLTRYTFGPGVDQILARTSAAGVTAWYLTDRLGSVRDVVSTSGVILDRIGYDAFGRVTSETDPTKGDRFKFTGRELDASGLQYSRARYYDASLGRWTQEDPIGFAGGDANLYRYVGNGPTNYTDPSGLDSVGVEGDKVIWRTYPQDTRSGFGKIFGGLVGRSPGPDRAIVVGTISSKRGYLADVILNDDLGGGIVPLNELQRAACEVNLGGTDKELHDAVVRTKIQQTIYKFFHSDLVVQDSTVGFAANTLQFFIDQGKGVIPNAEPVYDGLVSWIGIKPGAEADYLAGGFVGNARGTAYHDGKVASDASVYMSMAAASVPGGLGGARSANPPATSCASTGYTTSRMQARQLARQLTSEEQLSQAMQGQGTPMAGAGSKKILRDAPRLARQYGGDPADWAKMGSESSATHGVQKPNGGFFETHWYQNNTTGQIVEFKTKIDGH